MEQGSGTVEGGSGAPSTVLIEGVPIAYETRGAGEPVVLVHGWSSDRHSLMADLEPAFSTHPGWRRVYLDLPGHGQTPAPSWLATQDQMLTIVVQFIDRVVSNEGFAIVGSSYGGHVALGITRLLPERIVGAALLVPDLPSPDGARDAEEPIVLVEDRSIFTDLAPDEAWIADALVVHDQHMLDEIRTIDMLGYRAADYGVLQRLEQNYLPTGVAAEPSSGVAGPSLIAAGRQDSTVGFRRTWDLLPEFPRATLAVVDLAGHHLGRIERPELFDALVVDWLERMAMNHARGSVP